MPSASPPRSTPALNPGGAGQTTTGSEARLLLRWPGEGTAGECDNFFLGAWRPRDSLRVECVGTPPGCVERRGPNWFLASAASPLHPPDTGLVHGDAERSMGVAFRGYILPHLHSYSPAEEVLAYWEAQSQAEHNGVFSAASIGPGGNTLTLITDVLGMGPLYYRLLGDLVLYSTNSRYLAASDDRPDLLAWRSLVQSSWILGDRSLSEDVRRVPAGHAIRFSGDGQVLQSWFDFDRLPGGTRSVEPGSVGEVEEVFQQAIARCLGLGGQGSVLSLSSGFDSRRILASLVHRRVDFLAITRRVFQREYRDLDGRFASEMARAFGFRHTVVEPGWVDQYVADDLVRRLLVDSETREHSWVPQLMHALPAQPTLFFDGIAGDVLGNPVGWQVLTGLAVESRSPEHELEAIVAHAINSGIDSILYRDRWPSESELRSTLRAYLRTWLPRENLGELAFLLLRQRRSISLWSQQFLPPGHIPVCPYLDLDYLKLLLSFRSTEKHATAFQRACLREFWPEFYRYPGNRDVPMDMPPGSSALTDERTARCRAALWQEVSTGNGLAELHELLSLKGRIRLELSRRSRTVAARSDWLLTPVLELVARQARRRDCWTAAQ
jgi:hypothetical protein